MVMPSCKFCTEDAVVARQYNYTIPGPGDMPNVILNLRMNVCQAHALADGVPGFIYEVDVFNVQLEFKEKSVRSVLMGGAS